MPRKRLATKITGGIDWLEGLVECPHVSAEEWRVECFNMKREAQKTKDSCIYKTIGGREWKINGFGRRVGTRLPYSGECEGVYVAWGFNTKERTFNIKYQIKSLPCMQLGSLSNIGQHLIDVLQSMGFWNIEKVYVNRVDIAFDIPDLPVSTIVKAERNGRRKSRAWRTTEYDRQFETSRGKDSGISIYADETEEIELGLKYGKSIFVVRIYDKLEEMEIKRASEKEEFMKRIRYHGENPDCATRVEFQLRSKKLKEWGLKEFKALNSNLGGLTKKLVNDWLFFSCKKIDRENGNQARAKPSWWWKDIQNASKRIFGNGEIFKQEKELIINDEHQTKQGLGCIINALAVKGIQLPDDPQEAGKLFTQLLKDCKIDLSQAKNKSEKRIIDHKTAFAVRKEKHIQEMKEEKEKEANA
jgi:hypothetical protein